MQSLQPLGARKRKSDQMSVGGDEPYGNDTASQAIPTKGGSPHPEESPSKRQRVGITLAQKQALIDNLELEITERARKLRANYNIHAQSLRTRIEIRVNRIPLSLRRLTMGELLDKCSKEHQQQQQQKVGATATANTARGPPVPAKDKAPSRPPSRPPTRGAMVPPSGRPVKRLSHEITGTGGDKENDMQTPQKKMRANTVSDMSRNGPAHVLSPTTSNSRVGPRPTTAAGTTTTTTTTTTAATPARSGIARPATAATPGHRIVDGARSVRGAPTPAPPTTARKTLASSTGTTTSSSTAAAAAAARRKRGATVSAATLNPPRPGTAAAGPQRPTTAASTTRRASGASETSDASSTGTTIVRRRQPQQPARPMTAPPGAQPRSAPATVSVAQGKRIGAAAAAAGGKKGAVGAGAGAGAGAAAGRKTGVGKAAGAAGTGTGRVLRKRG